MKTFASSLLFAVALTVSSLGHAVTVYRCPKPGGGFDYTDRPCPNTGEKLDIRPNELNTSGSRAAADWAEGRAAQRRVQALEHQERLAQQYEEDRKNEINKHYDKQVSDIKFRNMGLKKRDQEIKVSEQLIQLERERQNALNSLPHAERDRQNAFSRRSGRREEERRNEINNRYDKLASDVKFRNMGLNTREQEKRASEQLRQIERDRRDALMGLPIQPPQQPEQAASTSPKAPASAPAPVAPSPVTPLVNCDPAGCWDTAGRRYNNAAGGNFVRNDGKFCVNNGGVVQCH